MSSGGAWVVSTKTPSARDPFATAQHGRPGDVSVLLYEDTNDSAWSPSLEPRTYRRRAPAAFTQAELAGHSRGHSRIFTLAGRFFDLFVRIGPTPVFKQRLAQLNAVVRSIQVQRGDFYPGRVRPAGFRTAPGWTVRHQGSLAVGTDNWVMTIASTVPWRDPLNDSPPPRSLADLRKADGIAILVSLEADNRFPPSARSSRLHFGALQPSYVTDGPPILGVSEQSGTATAGREYTVGVTVMYGTSRPTPAQRARARAELARLVLPRSPLWPRA